MTNLLTAAPRQLLVAAASVAALALAAVIGLAAGGEQETPAAQVSPLPTTTTRVLSTTEPQPTQAPSTTTAPTTTTTPAPTTTAEPAPPAPPQPEPEPEPEPQPGPGPQPEPEPEPQPEPEPEPEPTPPNLVPTVPSGFSLTPGADPVALPITVRNSGETASEPAGAALLLPPGVRATGGPASFAGRRPAQLDGLPEQTVTCPAGVGAITCAAPRGIAPGGTATFVFHLQADWEAMTGLITGTVSAGAAISVDVEVDVEVAPAEDDLELSVRKWQHHFWEPRLDVSVTNTGGRPGTARLVVETDAHLTLITLWRGCERSHRRVVCEVRLDRGETFQVPVWVFGLPWRNGVVRATATLGAATKTVEVPVSLRPGHDHGEPEPQADEPAGTPGPTNPGPATNAPATTTTVPRTTTAPPTTTASSPTTAPATAPSTPAPTSRTEPPPTGQPTTAPTDPTPAPTEPPTRRPEPCQPLLPWLPPLVGDLLPDPCRTPS
ncbi:hypothetical protein GCM10009634_21450 [Saccharothrix xinjiangensis]